MLSDFTPEDRQLVETYRTWPEKGQIVNGRRVSVSAAKLEYGPGEAVRVVHVAEATAPHLKVYIMGPKAVANEFVDGHLRGPSLTPGQDPFRPAEYDGRVLDSPAVDGNYEVTQYVFREPGMHEIVWRPGDLESNRLRITIRASHD